MLKLEIGNLEAPAGASKLPIPSFVNQLTVPVMRVTSYPFTEIGLYHGLGNWGGTAVIFLSSWAKCPNDHHIGSLWECVCVDGLSQTDWTLGLGEAVTVVH